MTATPLREDLHFDVVGAAGPKAYFERLTRESIAHAYVFSGPEGVGKKTFARRLAQSLLCVVAKNTVLGYDGTCASCRLFMTEHARHPDFIEHTGTLKIGDRDIAARFGESEELTARDLVRQLMMESYSGGARMLLLGDLDFATHHAANALLKFFEEPPRGVVLIVTTSSPGRLLPTIRSRTLEVRFPLLAGAEIIEVLRRKGYDEKRSELGARLGLGSVTRAVAALEEEETSVRTQTARWFFDVIAGETPAEVWATRDTLDAGLEMLKGLVRDWVVIHTANREPLFADYAKQLRKLRTLPPKEMTAILATLDSAQRLARTNVSPAMVSDLVRMALTGTAMSQ